MPQMSKISQRKNLGRSTMGKTTQNTSKVCRRYSSLNLKQSRRRKCTILFHTYRNPRDDVPPETPVELWTPRCWEGTLTNISFDETQKTTTNEDDIVKVYNDTMKQLSEAACAATPSPLNYQLRTEWEFATNAEKKECIEKASEACRLICSVIAPDASDYLYNELNAQNESTQPTPVIQSLMTAFASAPTRNLKTQILSIYAYDYTVKELQELHEPYEKITRWQIKRARAHAKKTGPGMEVKKSALHRISLDMNKVDHFLDFVNRPYFHQDVAFGMRKLRLESGDVIEMPNVIRTVTRSTMINQYQQHCQDNNFQPLSRATLYRILEVRQASERKALHGVDNTAADGTAAFDTLNNILKQLSRFGVEKVWVDTTERKLTKCMQYLKTDYKVHCEEDVSPCADHCRQFALSDPNEPDLQTICCHVHNVICENCEELKGIIADIETKLQRHCNPSFNQELRDDLLYDFNNAKESIIKWKCHILRTANQELAKQNILREMDDSSAMVVMDWAMKFTQLRYREKQSEWYGKRGLSWHISSVISKCSGSKELTVTSYAHLFDTSSQDWFAVASVVEDLLSHIKSENPKIRNVYIRSDEAGCYHNNLLIAAMKDIGDRVGVEIKRYDFSEPQQGKDICDRIICPLKLAIRTYCNEGNDVTNAQQMHTALTHHAVKGTTSSVNKINDTVQQLKVKKINQFSAYHNFKYDTNGITIWKAYGIGKGKKISKKSIYINHQQPTNIQVIESFNVKGVARGRTLKLKESLKDSEDSLDGKDCSFECTVQGCQYVFQTLEQLDLHLDVGEHGRFINNESVYDVIRREWANKFTTIDITTEKPQKLTKSNVTGSTVQTMGWALAKAKSGGKRFTDNVRAFLVDIFEAGEKSGSKADPAAVATEMRCERNKDGNRRFTRDEWLNQSQIKSFFSRFTKSKRSEGQAAANMDSDSENDEEAQVRQELIEQVLVDIGVTHPITYQEQNLCELSKKGKLSSLKVKMLKDICAYFEITTKSKDKKSDLMEKVSQMISNCTCVTCA